MPEFHDVPLDETPFAYEDTQGGEKDIPIISLTRNEALFLDDSFTLMIEREVEDQRITAMRPIQMTAALAVPMELMEKIGKAVVFTTNPDNGDKEYELVFDLSELLMIREIASSYIKIGEEPVGFNLKRKVCAILYGEEVEQEKRDKIASILLKDIDIDLLNTKVTDERKRNSES
tara:strand:- start:1367 stop:1891 length:525 start_codon:yes stop_codon:yes gene_type:complete